MLRIATTATEKMIKVDHAGENGAANIYRAQLIGASFFAKDLVADIRVNLTHEERHRKLFADQLERRDIRRCVSFHICGVGGFALGIATGFLGRQAIHATAYAVANVVLEHLVQQLDYLRKADEEAFRCVAAVVAEEQEHHDHAAAHFQEDRWLNRVLV